MVEQADGRPRRRPVSLITTGIDLTDRAPRREDDERALEGDPQAKLAEVGRLATEQRALRRVATLVASEVSPERVFTAVSEECARVLQVNASLVLRYEGDGTATIVGRHNRDNIDEFRVGERLPAEEHSAFARVLATGAPARIDDWGGLTGEVAEAIFRAGYRSTAAAPIIVTGTLWGAVAIAERGPAAARERGAPGGVLRARLAGGRQRPGARRSDRVARAPGQGRRRAAPAAGAQPARRRAAALRLASCSSCAWRGRGWHRDPEAAADLLDGRLARARDRRCRSCARSRAGCIRRSSATAGCGARWRRSPTASPSPWTIDAADEPLPEHVEATAYYIVSEALTNIAKHARAGAARSPSARDGGVLRCEVADDGRGGADTASGTGILGLRDRAEAAGGTLSLVSPPGRGTVVVAVLPLTDG